MGYGFASPNSTQKYHEQDDSKAAIQLLPSKPFKAEYVSENMWDDAV